MFCIIVPMDVAKIGNILLAIFLILVGVYYFMPILMLNEYYNWAMGGVAIIAALVMIYGVFKGGV